MKLKYPHNCRLDITLEVAKALSHNKANYPYMGEWMVDINRTGQGSVSDQIVNCGKKAHLLRVGIDSAGSHKGHESKFLSSHFQNFSGGGPPGPHEAFIAPELCFI